jgi:hypothetical protein
MSLNLFEAEDLSIGKIIPEVSGSEYIQAYTIKVGNIPRKNCFEIHRLMSLSEKKQNINFIIRSEC